MITAAQQIAPMPPKSSGQHLFSSSPLGDIKNTLATTMPSGRQTSAGIVHPEQSNSSSGNYDKWKKTRIFSPKQSPSAVTTENFFKARNGFEPIYMHDMAATRRALISILDSDRPRFSEKVNLLA